MHVQEDNVEEGEATPATDDDDDKSWKQLSKALSLCIAYSANIGGAATMTGSTPNLVLKGQLEM